MFHVEQDLRLKRVEFPPTSEAPGYFDESKTYIALIDGELSLGQFEPVWFGWHFANGYGASGGIQFDTPGDNYSGWQGLWEVEKC